MHRISFATDDDLELEIDLGKNAEGQPVYAHENAATLQLIYTDCVRDTKNMQEAYERFALLMTTRWGTQVSRTMSYLIVETCAGITNRLKKTHISERNSKSSESTPEG